MRTQTSSHAHHKTSHSQPPPPCSSGSGGSPGLFSGMMYGMAMGAGSSAGHHAVNSVVSSSSKSNTPNETPYSKTSCEAEFKTYIACSRLYEYGGEATLVKRDDAVSIDNFRQDCDGLLESYMKCMRSLGSNQG